MMPLGMKPYHLLLAALALVACALFACGCRQFLRSASPDKIVITGSSTVAPLVNEVARRFEKKHSQLRVDVQTGGSSRGIADVRSGLADIGMVSRDLKPDETDLIGFPIARDGICLIVHQSNAVARLSEEQVRAIYRGEIKNWQMLGGADAPITVVNKAEGRSTLELFLEYFELESAEVEADIVIGDNEQGVKTVAGNPHAIGYVSIGTAEYDRRLGVPIKALPMDGIEASTRNVANGTFPLARTLNLIVVRKPEGDLQRFLQFALANHNADLIEELAFVPLR